jgi:cell pole-organizing protein PopZ
VLVMGDISSEPSMEEILSSIKRIIAEEGDAAVTTRTRRGPRGVPAAKSPVVDDEDDSDEDEILELSEPVVEEKHVPAAPVLAPIAERVAEPVPSPAVATVAEVPAKAVDPILSDRAAQASRGQLEALSRMVVKPEVPGSDTLEGLVRELVKPMLRDWLDANLPQIVEAMVSREISRITGSQ